MSKLFPVFPGAFCVKYYAPYDARQIGGRCYKPIGHNKTCNGGIRSAVNGNDWKPCGQCNGDGFIDEKGCIACDRTGWICIRNREWMKGV
jgi:hypothetical protein